jgi:hypothetical protein
MGTQSSGSKVRYAVVGLGHIAQVAVLPAQSTGSCPSRSASRCVVFHAKTPSASIP